MADDEWVDIVHPDLKETEKEPARVRRSNFDKVWKPLGWKLQPKTKKEG